MACGMASTPAPTMVFTRLMTLDSHDALPVVPVILRFRVGVRGRRGREARRSASGSILKSGRQRVAYYLLEATVGCYRRSMLLNTGSDVGSDVITWTSSTSRYQSALVPNISTVEVEQFTCVAEVVSAARSGKGQQKSPSQPVSVPGPAPCEKWKNWLTDS